MQEDTTPPMPPAQPVNYIPENSDKALPQPPPKVTPGSEDLFKLVGVVAGGGCCLPIFLLTGFVVAMLFLAAIMQGCN